MKRQHKVNANVEKNLHRQFKFLLVIKIVIKAD